MASKQEQQKLAKILEDLHSSDGKKVVKAIKSLESNGNSSVILPLAELLLEGKHTHEAEIIELLCSLKDTSVTAEVMEIIEDERFLPIRQLMLSVVWNTKVDFSDYIDEFVLIATEGDFMEALDCLTIIENLEGPFMEENILESQLHLKNYMESNPPQDDQKAHILSEIALKLKDINVELMD